MRHQGRMVFSALVVFAGLAGLHPARATAGVPAAQPPPATAADLQRVQSELARVQQDLREQKQLIFQLMQMHDALLKYVQMGSGSGNPPSVAGLPPPSLSPSSAGAALAPTSELGANTSAASARGFIAGKVRAAALGEVYVYVDGPKIMATRSAPLEVKQQGRQFVPAVSVAQVGTRVLFPNEDKVFHNVFSPTPGDAFDLGTLKAGDRPNPVVMLKPGHVEVFCNIHSRMRADILVVPNSLWTRVRPDGSFQISGVPLGAQHVVLWGPAIKPVSQRVEVTPAGGSVSFSADVIQPRPHLNKQGGAYESYEH